ncbi:MAG: Clp protease N-terminal domain-containing protein [Planctomycetota bacterium]
MLALLREQEGRGAQILGHLGLQLDAVRQDVIRLVAAAAKA